MKYDENARVSNRSGEDVGLSWLQSCANYYVLGVLFYYICDLVDRPPFIVRRAAHSDAILLCMVSPKRQLSVFAECAPKDGAHLVSPINNTFACEVNGRLPMQRYQCKGCLLGREHAVSSKLREDLVQRGKLGEVAALG